MLLFANTARDDTLLILLMELVILLDILRYVLSVVRSVAYLKPILVLILMELFEAGVTILNLLVWSLFVCLLG